MMHTLIARMATVNDVEEFIGFTIVFVKADGQFIEVDRADEWAEAAEKVSLYNGGSAVSASVIGSSLESIAGSVGRIADALEEANESSGFSSTVWEGFKCVTGALEELRTSRPTFNEPRIPNNNALTGKFFHSFGEDGAVEWQGHVIVQCDQDTYCVQLFEWMLGTPSVQKVVPIKQMAGWAFYESLEQMNDTYGRLYAGKGRNI